ncbi:hypothetical protein RHMOL_Rhmol07G0157300 [Rhododendron molle]|uniref:Uncharacterized protein n=1 Tax=Rhododendron molle TaxID=49168 RepID=A0ACC0N1A1_RHOML|nr:hypothetical protein RHMOL_Rhmol07G0157300 [Rhododendron molle]
MDSGETPGADHSSQIEVTLPPIAPEGVTMAEVVPETTGVSDQATLAEEAMAPAAAVVGSGDDDGGSVVLAGYGQETETPGAVESMGGAEVSSQSEAVVGVEERTTEGLGGGSLDQVVEEVETSLIREPRTDLGKAPIVEGEQVVEPMVKDTPLIFVGSGTGAGLSRHIGMGDYLATASMEDVLEVMRGFPGLADALLAAREAELQAELGTGGAGEPEAEERRVDEEAGGVMAPRKIVRQADFGEFVGVLAKGVCNDRPVVRALAERWWDTTNTLHFSFGKLTVTPLDFAAITGLRVGGDHLSFDAHEAAAFNDAGYLSEAEADDAKYAQLLGFWTERLLTDRVEEEQMARCFLLYLLGASLFPNRRNRVHLSLLPASRDVGEIARFDWGGAALGTCYAFMGSLSRGAGVSLGGYWRLWTYEVIGMYPPETTCPDDTILLRALRWSTEYKGVKRGRGKLDAFRLYLDELRPDQSLRLDAFRVPGPLPALVQRTGQYTRREVERFARPDPELESFFQAGASLAVDYAEYRARYLMPSLRIRAAWEVAQAARGGIGGRRGRRRDRCDGGSGGDGGHGDGGRSEGAGPSGTTFPALSWTVDVTTPQGAPGLVVVPRPSAEAPEFLAQAPPGYVKEMAEAMMGLKQLVRQYAMGHPPEVLSRTGGTMARGGASRGLRWKSVRFPVRQVSSAGSREEPPSKRTRHSVGTEDEPIDVSEDETPEPTDVDLEATSGGAVPRATGTQEVSSSPVDEEVSEENEEEGEDGDDES